MEKLLKEFRLKHHMTQKELSTLLEVGESTVSAWERGTRKPTLTSKKWIEFQLKTFEKGEKNETHN